MSFMEEIKQKEILDKEIKDSIDEHEKKISEKKKELKKKLKKKLNKKEN